MDQPGKVANPAYGDMNIPQLGGGKCQNVVVDSHIQLFVLATEETTVTQQVSHRPIKCQSRCGHKAVPRSTGHIVEKTRYQDQQGSKSRQKVMRLCKQWHRPISKRFIKSYRLAFSATKRTDCAPTSFDQPVQVSQDHTSYRNKEN